MRAVFHYIEAVAKSQKPVFITGETGVGKELIAGTIHRVSGRKGRFVAVNVAGVDDTMFSDTLFGHIKGAYTGAERDREGLIARASHGTLFLDEIGDLKESSQVKLLRLIEERMYYQLGSDVPVKTDARIIVSSNKDIQKLVSEERFRKDLYYRLCAHHVHIPPLRERVEDIPLLVDFFLEEAANSLGKQKPVPSRELLILLSNYNFPGNVRELQAMVYDAVAQHDSGKLSMDSFKRFIGEKVGYKTNLQIPEHNIKSLVDAFGRFPTLKEVEEHLICEALNRSRGNQGIAASLLGITRQALNQRLKRKKKS
jgi:DNA-binding NtrC family response regulator